MASIPSDKTQAQGGMLRVISNSQMVADETAAAEAAEAERNQEATIDALASYIRGAMVEMRNFRNSQGISEALVESLRTYKGEYSPDKLQQIRQLQGSEVYARVTATKCRAATALLRDVFLGPERAWDIEPTPDPVVPGNIDREIQQLVNIETATMMQSGEPVDESIIADRVAMLRKAAKRAAKKLAVNEAEKTANKVDDILTEGGFYEALAEFLIDLPIFPFACIKGPVVRRVTTTKWQDQKPVKTTVAKMFWQRTSPFDLYWSPGAASVNNASFVERIRISRKELADCRELPGYDVDKINEVLERAYMDGIHDWWDSIDTERAKLEERQEWPGQMSTLIDAAEFTGHVSGRLLREWGMSEEEITDEYGEYFVTAWMIDRWVIKVQINPSTSQRAPYYITSFEKVPGALLGSGLPQLLEDVQSICNASARALVNNSSIASGPQVVVNDFVVPAGENDDLYPWKRWHVSYDPSVVNSGTKPVEFYQPNINAAELMGIYERWSAMGDEISAIPRYMTGNEKVGGAGRTASGLAMLMGNASKTLQNVAASIDRDVVGPMLHELFDTLMSAEAGVFKGDEQIVVKGVNHAVKREQDRMRQLEFLQLTANPIDMSIVGVEGRANVLRSVAQNLGLDHEKTLPDDEELKARLAAEQQQQAAMQQGPGGGDPNQNVPRPKEGRAGPEAAREQVEGQFNGPTGTPGMRMGG